MNLEERIKAGMLFYESGHVDPVNQEIEERLENERKDCKELMQTGRSGSAAKNFKGTAWFLWGSCVYRRWAPYVLREACIFR